MTNYRSTVVIILFYTIICGIVLNKTNWFKDDNIGVFAYDNFGYYLYLPATFIHDDLALKSSSWVDNVKKEYELPGSFYQAHALPNGNRVIQYTSGMALIYMPAFWMGHIYALNSQEFKADGFSKPYQYAVLFEALIIILLGLLFCKKILLSYFKDRTTAISIFILVFGTNYFQICISNTTSPHPILFSFYALLIYTCIKWNTSKDSKYLIYFSICFAILCLSRANEIISILLIVLWGVSDWNELKENFKRIIKKKKWVIIGCLCIVSLATLQIVYWKYTSNKFLFDSYKDEDFKFFSPYLFEYLFSYKKGLLLYTPILILPFLGLYSMFKHSRGIFYPLFWYTLLNIWILSSWDCWWYADSFGQRSIIQSLPIFLIPISFGLERIFQLRKRVLRILLVIILVILVFLNLFQTYQQYISILHSSRMTKEYYWSIFGSTSLDNKYNLLEPERGIHRLPVELSYKTKQCLDSAYSIALAYPSINRTIFKKPYSRLSNEKFPYFLLSFDYKIEEALENAFIEGDFTTIDHRSEKLYGNHHFKIKLPNKLDSLWKTKRSVYSPPYLRSIHDTLLVKLKTDRNSKVNLRDVQLTAYYPLHGEESLPNYTIELSNDSATIQLTNFYSKLFPIHSKSPFSFLLSKDISKVNLKKKNFRLEVSNYYGSYKAEVTAVVCIFKKGKNVFYKSFYLDNTKTSQFFDGSIDINIPNDSELRVYLWNKSNNPFYYESLKIEFQ